MTLDEVACRKVGLLGVACLPEGIDSLADEDEVDWLVASEVEVGPVDSRIDASSVDEFAGDGFEDS